MAHGRPAHGKNQRGEGPGFHPGQHLSQTICGGEGKTDFRKRGDTETVLSWLVSDSAR